jgi:hypothetical protein
MPSKGDEERFPVDQVGGATAVDALETTLQIMSQSACIVMLLVNLRGLFSLA